MTENFCPHIQNEPPVTAAVDSAAVASKQPTAESLTILALDLGTKTGWASRYTHGSIISGTETFQHDRWQGGGMRFLKFHRWLDHMRLLLGKIDAVYFEEVRRHLGVDAAHAYGGFLAQLTAWCEQQAIAYEAIPVGTIKRYATGKGNASKTLVMQSVRDWGYEPTDDNEDDALALLHCVADQNLYRGAA